MVRSEYEMWRDELANGPRFRWGRFLIVFAIFLATGALGVLLHHAAVR